MPKLHPRALLWTLSTLVACTGVHAAEPARIPPAIVDVPSQVGVMVGMPPLPENQVNLRNYAAPRFMRWTLSHMSSVFSTDRVSRGSGMPVALPQGPALDVDALSVDWQGQKITMAQAYRLLGADALLVLHRGQLVFERYFGDVTPATVHATNSCTKSFVGTLAVTLAQEGKLDLTAPASRYVPELAASALGSATVQELLDMRANFRIGDDVHQAGSLQVGALQAYGVLPRPADYAGPDGAIAMMLASKPTIPHGTGPMRYDNASTEAVGWILNRVTGKSIPELIGERLWQPIGAERDADFLLDRRQHRQASRWLAAG